MTAGSGPGPVEITDLVRSWAADGSRRPVGVDEVVARLRASGQDRAARIVSRMPASGGVLDDDACDALVLRVHRELQRLWEEVVQARRARALLDPLVRPLLAEDDRPVRIVDVGCGLGYLVRWLAAHGDWGARVELVGVDLDGTLVAEARRLAAVEALDVTFVHGDALAPGRAVTDPGRTWVVSSGVLHHLPAPELQSFFAAQHNLGVRGFAHWDPVPGALHVLGSRVFHAARMREAVSRHDGVLSVVRAHPVAVVLDAARRGSPGYDVASVRGRGPAEVLHAVVGQRA